MPTEPTLKEKTAKGLFWGGISSGVQQLLGAVFGIVLARILDPSDYGMVGMLAIFGAIAGTIMDSGFTTALTNKKEVKHEDYNAVFWFALFCGIFFYAVLFFCAPLIADFYDKPELTNLSRIVFLGILFGGIGYTHNAYLYKNLMAKERAKIDIFSLLTSNTIGLILALNDFAYWGLAIQGASYIGVGSILRTYYSPWRPTMEFNFHPLKEMFGFSSKLLATNIFQQINFNLFSVILGKFYSTAQVGFYSQGVKWYNMGNAFLTGMINGVAHPTLAQVQEDRDRQIAAFRKLIRFGSFLSFPAMLGLAFVGEEFILITVGEKWMPAVPFLQLFCIWGSVYFIYSLYTTLLMLLERSTAYMYGIILTGVLQLISCYLMYPFGILPMVSVYLLIYILSIGGWHIYVSKLLPVRIKMILKDTLPYLLITLFSFAIAWLAVLNVDNIYLCLLIKVAVSAAVYIAIMYKTNSVIFKECVGFVFKKK